VSTDAVHCSVSASRARETIESLSDSSAARNPRSKPDWSSDVFSSDLTAPTVTINQAAGQADPTNASPITFTVVFSEAVSGFTEDIGGMAGRAGVDKSVTAAGGPNNQPARVTGRISAGQGRPAMCARAL